ncbi:MAG: hypothetical protein KBE65_09985 [Phycisphaerae bacterium]|nr:hypothetical protein [Phycisphaerae bacterium]
MGKRSFYLIVALVVAGSAGLAAAADIGKGNILFEEWFDSSITSIATLQSFADYPDNPHKSYWATAWDRPDGGEDYWGCRSRGYIYPPQTGDYTFWVASDDYSIVWLSTDESPANMVEICAVDGWMDYQNFAGTTGSPGTRFKSAAIPLTAGKRYYVETIMNDGTGGGTISVAWGGPGIGAGPVVVAGKYLAPWLRDPEPMLGAKNPSPADGAINVVMPVIQWTKGATAVWHDFYFGTDPNPPLIGRQTAAFYYYAAGAFEPGQTYYWKVDEIEADGTVRPGEVWSFTAQALIAFAPTPANGATNQMPGLILTWVPGKDFVSEHMYFGMDADAVAEGAASVDQGAVKDSEFNTGALRASTTYYWRVDTSTGAAVLPGNVWSFTTCDAGPANKIMYEYWLNISGTAISALTGNARYPNSPDHAEYVDSVDSAVDWANYYGQRYWGWLKPPETGNYTFWVAGDDYQEFWLSTDANPANATVVASVIGYTAARDFDNTGGNATAAQKSSEIALTAGEKYFFMVIGKEGDGGDSTSAAWQGPGIDAREIITSDYVDMFALKPLQSFGPTPANGVVDVVQDGALSWEAGEQAEQHEVYFGEDANAVATADTSSPLFMGKQSGTTFDAGNLDWNKTYYWRVDEVGASETWKGNVWSFTTANFLLIDGFESYNDDDNRIYDAWLDGYLDKSSGSQVGYIDSAYGTFGETTIIHGGKQSMPLLYNNTGSPYYSEATMSFASAQDLSAHEANTISVFFRGIAPSFAQSTDGEILMNGIGADIWDVSDAFRFAYKTLNGNGSIVARVNSLYQSNTWAKAGVMIRQSTAVSAVNAMMAKSALDGNGASFQWRPTAAAASSNADAASVGMTATFPYWVKVERIGNSFSGYISPDGTTWTQLGTAQTITMTDPVLIGLAVTSHDAAIVTGASFSDITTTGNVTGAWTTMDISSTQVEGNSVERIYLTAKDNSKSVTLLCPDLMATGRCEWQQWLIPLSDITAGGVKVTAIKSLAIGIGNRPSPTAGGTGTVYFDDIRVIKP